MKHFASIAAFAASVNALVGRTDNCCFKLTASGGASGDVGQLGDGQNRVGDSSLAPATYCIDSSGSITDSSGRGCILTPPTTQFQCDTGATPTPGFSVNSHGKLEYEGSTTFIVCETGQNGGMNIYTTKSSGTTHCKRVTLTASSCSGSGAGVGSGAPGAGPSGTPGAGPSSTPGVGPSSAPGVGPSGAPGAGPSGAPGVGPSGGAPGVGPSGGASGAPGAGPSGAPGAAPSGAPGAGPAPTSAVPVATPGSSIPGAGGSGGPATGGAPPQSSPGGAGGGRKTKTVYITETVSSCPAPATGVPTGPGAGSGGAPAGPGAGSGGAPAGPGAGSSGAPAGPGAGSSGAPAGPGAGSGGAPAGPGAGSGGAPTGPGAGTSCPTNLSGNYQYPHLITPIDSSSPDKAEGDSLNGTVTSTVSTIFNFDIPKSYSGKTCSLVFLFPKKQDLETSSFSFSGNGKVDIAMLSGPATHSTSYSNRPSVKQDFGDFTVSPGNSYLISTFECPAGQTVSYEMSNAGSTNLNYFQDYNPSPLGMYITVC